MNATNKYATAVGHLANVKDKDAGEAESPMQKANRLGWELAETLDTYLDGRAMATIYPKSVRPEFAVGFLFLGLGEPKDPLLETIREYDAGKKAFEEIPDGTLTYENEEEFIMQTYGTALDRLVDWKDPAMSRATCVEALRIMEEQDVYNDPLGRSMARVILRYLESL